MAKDNRIWFYTDGSAARELEPELPRKKKSRLPKMRRRVQPVLYYDPLAMISLAVTALMLVLMVAGIAQLVQSNAAAERMAQQVQTLRQENARLQEEYESAIDLDAVREDALAMGMIPRSEAQTMTIDVVVPAPERPQPTLWQQIWSFLTSLFA